MHRSAGRMPAPAGHRATHPHPQVDFVVKLGGAAITHKAELETLNAPVLQACIAQLAQLAQQQTDASQLCPRPTSLPHEQNAPAPASPSATPHNCAAADLPTAEQPSEHAPSAAAAQSAPARAHGAISTPPPATSFVVVHGAGGYGHQIAAASGIATGGLRSAAARTGFARTRASVTKLNALVTDGLVTAGLPAVSISPLGLWHTTRREVTDGARGCAAVRDALAAGLVPVVHGDCVWDTELECTVLGGDKLVCSLAAALQPRHVVFLTNVPGLYSAPPGEAGAVLLREIRVQPDGSWSAGLRSSARMPAAEEDVTGGIASKVAEAAAIAATGVPVLIAQAGSASGLVAMQRGVGVLGDPSWQGTAILAADQMGGR